MGGHREWGMGTQIVGHGDTGSWEWGHREWGIGSGAWGVIYDL